jgi:transglutaminase-like putative cysteine protease
VIADARVIAAPAAGGHADDDARQSARRRPSAQLAAFAALGLYGVLRWGTMLSPNPTARLVALVCIAVAVAALGALPTWIGPISRRWLAAAGLLVGLVGMLAVSGLPAELIYHVRIAVAARRIGRGLDGLPQVLVPYGGHDAPLREVILMGAGVLLLDGAAMLAFSTAPLGELRLAVASLPLLVLALVPAALARPALPYLQGAVLFVLLTLFVLGGRLRAGAGAALVVSLALATVAGMAIAPALAQPRPWLDFERITAQLAGSRGETFNWAQGYGKLRWPATGQPVLLISAPRPSYWKAEDQDIFDGYGWQASSGAAPALPPGSSLRYVSRRALARFSARISVRVRDMTSPQVIFAGTALGPPSGLSGIAMPGPGDATLMASPPLEPGARYQISVYAPHPTAAQLSADAPRYPSAIAAGYLQMQLPPARLGEPPVTVSFAPFGSDAGPSLIGPRPAGASSASAALQASPYAGVYALARRLAAPSATPYALALAIERYLDHGFTYDTDPPSARYPIAAFLLHSHAGYCQQFSGAMALLLRMGGVPARVVSGFVTGTPLGPGSWQVSDLDAHSWVEAWFAGYGWVTFDPTPGGSNGDGLGSAASASVSAGGSSGFSEHRNLGAGQRRAVLRARGASAFGPQRRAGGLPSAAIAALGAALLLAALLVLVGGLMRPSGPDALAELTRAFAVMGRPLGGGVTLAALEQRLAAFPEAAAYVRALRQARYAERAALADGARLRAQRRALRRALAQRGGVLGRARALWALPPRRRLHWR